MLPKLANLKKQSHSNNQIIKSIKNTEKAIRQLEGQGIIIFVLAPKTKKEDLKKLLIEEFKVKPIKITTQITPKGEKIARVRFSDVEAARNLAMRFGIL